MGFLENYQRARADFNHRYEAVIRLSKAMRAGQVLREDGQAVLKVLRSGQRNMEKERAAVSAANWLCDPVRTQPTKAEQARINQGLPRHLTPLEVLALF